jgi:hypothetical protein
MMVASTIVPDFSSRRLSSNSVRICATIRWEG